MAFIDDVMGTLSNKNTANTANDNISTYMDQARAILDPEYQNQLNTTMNNLDRNSINRGFYGQLPQDVFKRSTAGNMANAHEANLANYANQLYQADRNYNLQQQQLDLQRQQLNQNNNNNSNSGGSIIGDIIGGIFGGLF